ncbi:MAG: peptidoglycan D,D-transpeptidase FtsI family protein [Dehalococcoidia bacterium]
MLAQSDVAPRLARAGLGVLAVASILLAALTYWAVFRDDLSTEDGNPRLLARFSDPLRGRILARDGAVLAESAADGSRVVHDASYAHAIGYIDARYGSQGAELAFDGALSGEQAGGWQGALDRELFRRRAPGADVTLTLDPALQRAAATALGARRGAGVALDPRTGEVLAMVSVPTYDPSALAEDGEALLADPSSPLLNRATQGLYPPGSTFKVVTAASLLEHRVVTLDTRVTCPGEIVIDGFPISCRNVAQGVGTYPFRDAFAFSVNAVFAQLGVTLGWERLEATARAFGFGGAPSFELETAAPRLRGEGERSEVLLATTAFGQGELLATPLQMALVAATVANGGVQPAPRLGFAVVGRPVAPAARRKVLEPGIAEQLRSLMVAAVASGQAAGIAVPGVTVAGKTGTAETGIEGRSHAWFIGFAPADAPVVAVAVIVENGGRGGEVASPVAGAIFRAAMVR